jgi:PEP-CTERM motif-containing protein
MQMGKMALGLAAALVMGLAGGAQGTTLADLSGGQSLTVGGLTFSDFTITVNGAIDSNLADYKVLTLSDGFRITGGIGVFDGDSGDMLVSYEVSAAAGSPAVNDIRLVFNGAATGAHSGATVSEDLFGIPSGDPIASASVLQTAAGLSQKTDSVTFAPQTSFTVEKDILVKSGSDPTGGLATISFIDQHFSVVPEPGSLVLLSSGLMGLLAFGRKRKSQS